MSYYLFKVPNHCDLAFIALSELWSTHDYYFLAGPTIPRLPESIREISVTSSSATIQWMLTDPYNPSHPETFIVSYGVTSGQLNMSTPGVTANPTNQTYSTQLNSLQPGTEYFYRIESRNGRSSVFTDILSFMSMDKSKKEH